MPVLKRQSFPCQRSVPSLRLEGSCTTDCTPISLRVLNLRDIRDRRALDPRSQSNHNQWPNHRDQPQADLQVADLNWEGIHPATAAHFRLLIPCLYLTDPSNIPSARPHHHRWLQTNHQRVLSLPVLRRSTFPSLLAALGEKNVP